MRYWREEMQTIEQEYIKNHPKSAELFDRAGNLFPDGVTHDTRRLKPFPIYATKAQGALKWDVDGHDIKMLSRAINDYDEEKRPTVVIANTKKGNGIIDIENDIFAWHHRAPNDNEYKKFMEELDES